MAEGFDRIAGPVTATTRVRAIARRERQRRGRRDAFLRNREAQQEKKALDDDADDAEQPRVGRFIDEQC